MGKSKNLIMKIYFLTYGNKAFHYSKIHLCSLAKESGFYDGIISLKPSDLDKNFRLKFENILKEGRGSGYWIWKHEIIRFFWSWIPFYMDCIRCYTSVYYLILFM